MANDVLQFTWHFYWPSWKTVSLFWSTWYILYLTAITPCTWSSSEHAHPQFINIIVIVVIRVRFVRASAGTAIARLSHRNSVRLSVCHTGGSSKNDAS